MYFLSFHKVFKKILLVFTILVIFTVRHFNICVTRKLFLMKVQKQDFQTWKKLQNVTKIWDLVWQLLILFFFIRMFWSISAHWCFQKIIGSGLALWWSSIYQGYKLYFLSVYCRIIFFLKPINIHKWTAYFFVCGFFRQYFMTKTLKVVEMSESKSFIRAFRIELIWGDLLLFFAIFNNFPWQFSHLN